MFRTSHTLTHSKQMTLFQEVAIAQPKQLIHDLSEWTSKQCWPQHIK